MYVQTALLFSYTANKSDELLGFIWFALSPKFQSCKNPARLLQSVSFVYLHFSPDKHGLSELMPNARIVQWLLLGPFSKSCFNLNCSFPNWARRFILMTRWLLFHCVVLQLLVALRDLQGCWTEMQFLLNSNIPCLLCKKYLKIQRNIHDWTPSYMASK